MTKKLLIFWTLLCLAASGYMQSGSLRDRERRRMWEDIERGDVLAWATHVTGQDVNDWTVHDRFESVAVIAGHGNKPCGDANPEDEVWVVVQRTIDGNDVRYIEQFTPLDWGDDPNWCWFVDCGGQNEVYVGESIWAGEYPTLRELTDEEIPAAASAPDLTPGTTAVANAVELQAISGSGAYYLTGNIDLNGVDWTPIGSVTPFTGVLDGRGYTISNLTLNAPASNNQALFAQVGDGVEIYDVSLSNFSITGQDYVSALIAQQSGVGRIYLRDITVNNPTLSGRSYVAGILCYAGDITKGDFRGCDVTNGTINSTNVSTAGMFNELETDATATESTNIVDCHVVGGTINAADAQSVGGFIADATGRSNYYMNFHSCSTDIDIVAEGQGDRMGGFIQYSIYANHISCYSDSNITVTNSTSSGPYAIGGYTGWDDGFNTYTDCHATGDIAIDATGVSTLSFVGGFIGQCLARSVQTLLRCYSTGDITLTNMAGGGDPTWEAIGGFIGGWTVIAASEGGTIERCWSDGDVTLNHEGQPNTGQYGGLGGFIGSIFFNSNTLKLWAVTIENCYAWGSVLVTVGDDNYHLAVSGFIGTVATSGSTGGCGVTVTNNYNAQTDTAAGSGYTDQIVAGTYSKGLIGYVETGDFTVTETACFWDTQTSGILSDTYAEGHETTWMQTEASYEAAGWDMDTIWILTETVVEDGNYVSPVDTRTVCVYADGVPRGTFLMDGNDIVDFNEADYNVVIAGLNYFSIYESFPLTFLKTGVRNVAIDFYESLGANIGVSYAQSEAWRFSADDFATRIDPVTQIKFGTFPRGWTRDPILYLWIWEPLPMTLRAYYPTLEVRP